MKVPLYILGFLLRYGPQHGYLLKQYLDQVSDFASIKLPTVYYHLEKMEKKGLISASQEKDGKRPEKWVYTITSEGQVSLQNMLQDALDSQYHGEFLFDSALFFSDLVHTQHILDACTHHISRLEHHLETLEKHQQQTLEHLPEEAKMFSNAIFNHHSHHTRAELTWLQETVGNLRTMLS